MNHKWMLTAALAFTLVAYAQKKDSPELILGAGLHQEEVEGNCREAIKIYQQLIQQKNTPRNVAARAQLHIGICEEKLGQREARVAYEAVVGRFADQADPVAEARERIAALAGTSSAVYTARTNGHMVNRQVWTLDPDGRSLGISADGRYVAYMDKSDLLVRNLFTGENRRLFKTDGAGQPAGAAFSRDGKQLVFSWQYDSDDHVVLWLIDVQQPSSSAPRRLVTFQWDGEPGGYYNWVNPTDWSPDGTRVAVYIQREEGPSRETQKIALVNAKDGSLTVLRSEEVTGRASQVLFSPDGRFLAYSFPAAKAAGNQDIAVMSVEGKVETSIVVDPSQDNLVGWAPDGKKLLFTSDRTGSQHLYAIAFANGKAQSAPILIKQDFSAIPRRLTSSGELFYEIRDARRVRGDIQIASYDFTAERFIEPPTIGVKDFVGNNAAADWSPDGKYLLNISERGSQILVIHSAETGQFIRELRPSLRMNQNTPWPRWTADSRSIAVPASDMDGRQGIFLIDARTGESSPLVLSQPRESVRGPAFSPDGKKFLYTRILSGPTTGPQSRRAIMERDLQTGMEKEIVRGNLSVVLFSPDGKYFTSVRTDNDVSSVLLFPANGGEPKELMRMNWPQGLWVETWAADSRSVYVQKLPEPAETFWRVFIDGSEPRTVRLDENMGLSARVHPDGRRVAYAVQSQVRKTELWVLENFLSAF
jgi:Tol biopolymer transport system component